MNKILTTLAICTLSIFNAKAQHNKFEPKQIWTDNNGVHINAHGGGILVMGKKYYWYGEHKVAGELGNTAQVGVHCYSSTDLYNWKDEGIALKVEDNAKSDIAKGCILERPKVVYNKKTKKYVMWFHLELLNQGYKAARAGVAIADKPNGPFKFIKSLRPNPGIMPYYPTPIPIAETVNCQTPANKVDGYFCRDMNDKGQMARDMTVFVDTDSKAYHIFASEENFTLHVAELSDDYLSHTGKFTRVHTGQSTEAPAIFKHNGTYYMFGSGCTGWAPNPGRWFKSKSIWGPWQFMGNPCIGENANTSYGGQSTHVLPVTGKKGAYIFMGDAWNPKNAIDGRYLWLPVVFNAQGDISIPFRKEWRLEDL